MLTFKASLCQLAGPLRVADAAILTILACFLSRLPSVVLKGLDVYVLSLVCALWLGHHVTTLTCFCRLQNISNTNLKLFVPKCAVLKGLTMAARLLGLRLEIGQFGGCS